MGPHTARTNVFLAALFIGALVFTSAGFAHAQGFPPASCLDKIDNDPYDGHPGIDCADYTNGYPTCSMLDYHGGYCPPGYGGPACIPGQHDYDGQYKAGWVCIPTSGSGSAGGSEYGAYGWGSYDAGAPYSAYGWGDYASSSARSSQTYLADWNVYGSLTVTYGYPSAPYCGDRYCDYYEYAYGTCPFDCGYAPNYYFIPPYPVCGDGVCSYYEAYQGYCYLDCGFGYGYVPPASSPAPAPTPTPQPPCADGTPAGQCSLARPLFCSSAGLIDRSSLCGCPDGYVRNGESCTNQCRDGTLLGDCSAVSPGAYCNYNGHLESQPAYCTGSGSGTPGATPGPAPTPGPVTACQVTLNPSTIRDGTATTVLLNYQNWPVPPATATVVCDNGDTVTAICNGPVDPNSVVQPVNQNVTAYACPATYAPVCGADGNTYGNDCAAAANGVNIAYAGVCISPPATLNVQHFDVTQTTATVTWASDAPATARLEWGTTTALGTNTTNATASNNHYITLSGLQNGVTHYYRAWSCNNAGCTASGVQSFTTGPAPTTPIPIFIDIRNANAWDINTDRATISWDTNVASTSLVEYGVTTAYGTNTTRDASLVSWHQQALTGLQSNTLYYYRVWSCVGSDCNSSGPHNFTTGTPPSAPPTPISIHNVYSGTPGTASATITWDTNVASDSFVEWGLTLSYGTNASGTALVQAHSLSITGLQNNTTYNYRVRSCASGTCTYSGNYNFTTGQQPASTTQVINYNVRATDAATNAITISWLTTVASNTQVDYGPTLAYGYSTTLDPANVTSHSQRISALPSATTFYFRVRSCANVSGTWQCDQDGSNANGYFAFETLPLLPPTPNTVYNVRAVQGTTNAITIAWDTTVPSTTQVEYTDGATTWYTTLDNTNTTAHGQRITGLPAGTTFSYRAWSCSTAGCVSSAWLPFETLPLPTVITPPPVVFDAHSRDFTQTSALIAWDTTLPANGWVEYGPTPGLGLSTAVNWMNTTSHSQGLLGLTPGATYYYRAWSCNAGGCASSPLQSFVALPVVSPLSIPLFLYNVGSLNVSTTSATVAWNSNVNATTTVEYGTSANLTGAANATASGEGVSHLLQLNNLAPYTTYYYRAWSCNAGGCASSTIQSFTTLIPTLPSASGPNTFLSGTCVAQCGYSGSGEPYPAFFNVQAFIQGQTCASALLRVLPPAPTDGTLLVSATQCTTGEPLPGARVVVTAPPTGNALYASGVYTDANGEVLLDGLDPQVHNLQVSQTGYATESVSATPALGKVTRVSVCLDEAQGSFTAQLVSAPTAAGSTASDTVYQLRLTNLANQPNALTLQYSALFPIDGPSTLTLNPLETRLVTLTAKPDANLVGGSHASAYLRSALDGTAKNVPIPIVLRGGVRIDALDRTQTAFGGERACYKAVVRNTGIDSGVVYLTAVSELPWSFDADALPLQRNEVRHAQFCVDVPSGARSGTYAISLKALSALNDDEDAVTLSVPAPTSLALVGHDASTCDALPATGEPFHQKLSFRNDALSASYDLVVRGLESIGATPTQSALWNFQAGSTRDAYLAFPAAFPRGGEYRYTVELQKDGATVFQQERCAAVQAMYGVDASITPSEVAVARGAGASARLTLRNTGNVRDTFLVTLQGPTFAYAQPNTLALPAGAQGDVTLEFRPTEGTPAGPHAFTVNVYSLSAYGQRYLLASTTAVARVADETGSFEPEPIGSGDPNNVFVAEPSFTFAQTPDGTRAEATFAVTNRGDQPVALAGKVTGLPDGWTATVDPREVALAAGETKNVKAAMVAPLGAEAKDYPATLELRAGDQKAGVPFTVPLTRASSLTGFFTLGGDTNWAVLALILILGALGGLLLLNASRALEETKG